MAVVFMHARGQVQDVDVLFMSACSPGLGVGLEKGQQARLAKKDRHYRSERLDHCSAFMSRVHM